MCRKVKKNTFKGALRDAIQKADITHIMCLMAAQLVFV